jgi:hypothetical protein
MKKRVFARAAAALLCVFAALPLAAQTVSGTADTRLRLSWGTGAAAPDIPWGAEEYANLRFRFPAGDNAALFGAFNVVAASGSFARDAERLAALYGQGGLQAAPLVYGENYAASVEPERLYLQIAGETIQWSAGLLRIPLGYGSVWRPLDFLNPANPLRPDARLRGALGTVIAWFPREIPGALGAFFADGDAKVQGFAAAPKEPLSRDGGGIRFGIALENHGEKASVQFLYAAETPACYAAYPALGISSEDYPHGLHRLGFSVKADFELGIAAECLYTLNPDSPKGIEGLAFSLGADYSLLDGDLVVLAEYLYSGQNSVTARGAAGLAGYANRHYLYAAGTWIWSDFTRITFGCAASPGDYSATPLAAWEHELFQGITLNIRAQIPLDRESAGAPQDKSGEFGPVQSGARFIGTAGVKVRF